jgi:hypothetical protein
VASRTFEVFYKVVITWEDEDNPSKSTFLKSLTVEDAVNMADEMQELGVAKFEFDSVREV